MKAADAGRNDMASQDGVDILNSAGERWNDGPT